MKKFICFILSFAFMLLTVPVCVNANTNTVYEDDNGLFEFILNDGYAVITGFSDSGYYTVPKDLTIPAYVYSNGVKYSVMSVGAEAFKGNLNIKTLIVEDGVQIISSGAFQDCTTLTSVALPPSLTTLESRAFKYCISIISVKLSEGLKSIGSEAFYRCTKINSIILPSTLEKLYLMAFNGCTTGIMSITLLSDLVLADTVDKNRCTFNTNTKFYVKTQAQKTHLTTVSGVNSGNITVLGSKTLFLLPEQNGKDITVIDGSNGNVTLPLPEERTQFSFAGWKNADGELLFTDTNYELDNEIEYLTAVWNFSNSTERITDKDMEDCVGYPDQVEALVKKDESLLKKVGNKTKVTVNVDETTVLNKVVKNNLGVQFEASGTGLLMNLAKNKLSDEFYGIADDMFEIPLARWGGTSSNYINLMNNIGPYEQRTDSVCINDLYIHAYENGVKKGEVTKGPVSYGPVEFINSVLEINPDAEFVFSLSLYTMTPAETEEFIHFLMDKDEKWASMREASGLITGRDPVRLVGLELGNELWGDKVRNAPKNETGVKMIFDLAEEYADVCVDYTAVIKKAREELGNDIKIITITPADDEFWQRTWNRAVIRYLRPYDDGVYALHCYGYSVIATFIDKVINDITSIYREEIGYSTSPQFIMTEHAIWDSNSYLHKRNSLYSALSELVAMNTLMLRSDVIGANYHTMASYGSLWSMIMASDGKLTMSPNARAYKAYLENIGDRVVKATYSDFVYVYNGKSYPLDNVLHTPDRTASILVTAEGNDTIKVIAVSNSYPEVKDTEIFFNFKNTYDLTSAKVFTAPNMHSYISGECTENVFTFTERLTAPKANCISYTLPPQSAAFLTFKLTDGVIANEIADTKKILPDDALYRNLLDGIYGNNGVYELHAPTKIDRVLIKDEVSADGVVVSARKLDGNWEIIADRDMLSDKGTYFPSAEKYYDALKLSGVSKDEVVVLASLHTDDNVNDVTKTSSFRIYPRFDGIDRFNDSTIETENVSCSGDGRINRGNALEGTVTVSYGTKSLTAKLFFAQKSDYFSMNDDFSAYEPDESIYGGNTGDGIVFANGNWISSISENPDKQQILPTFGIINTENYTEKYCNNMDGNGLVICDSYSKTGDIKNYQAALYNGDTSYLGDSYRIKTRIARTQSNAEYGIKFMVHNEGKNFYALIFDAYAISQTGPMWTLWKVENEEATRLMNGVSCGLQSGVTFNIDLIYDRGNIEWQTTDEDGLIIENRSSSYTDSEPFKEKGSTFGFLCHTNSKPTDGGYGILVDYVEVEALTTANQPRNDIYSISYINGNRQNDYDGNLEFELSSDYTATVKGFRVAPTTEYELVIPRSVCFGGELYKVTAIGNNAFSGVSASEPNTLIQNVVFPDTIDTIGDYAFAYCTALDSLEFPAGLKSIGTKAFISCTGIKTIGALPEGVALGQQCFDSLKLQNNMCTVIPGSVTPAKAFKSARFSNVVFGENMVSLDSEALYSNRTLTKLFLPSTCTSFSANSLNLSDKITDIYILAENIEFSSNNIFNVATTSKNVTFHVVNNTVKTAVERLNVVGNSNNKLDVMVKAELITVPFTVLCTTPQTYELVYENTFVLPQSSFEGFVLKGYTDGKKIYKPNDIYNAEKPRVLTAIWERDEANVNIISEYEDRVEIYSPEDTDATCVTAYFDNTGILQDVSMKNIALSKGVKSQVSLKNSDGCQVLKNGGYIEIFLMDNLNSINPLWEKYTHIVK